MPHQSTISLAEPPPEMGRAHIASTERPRTRPASVWIDLDNSPHVPLFAPVIEELQRRGHRTLVTARDCFQVRELANLLGVEHRLIGRHYGERRVFKLAGLCIRASELAPTILRGRPDLALSHGSRAQLLLCAALRIPSIVMVDYEFAAGLTTLRPTWLMAPEAIPATAFHFDPRRIESYPGIKEDIYVPKFSIDPAARASLGLRDEDLVVTVRPPANEAHYHNPESEVLFEAVMNVLLATPGSRVVVLPRNSNQHASIRQAWAGPISSGRVLIPAKAIDGLNLIWASDLVISGGGTMNREAAALGVPVYSIFRGKIGAVDRYLVKTGRLTLLESVEDIATKLLLQRRVRRVEHSGGSSVTLEFIVNRVESLLTDVVAKRKRVTYGS